jgi:hypothetical protein
MARGCAFSNRLAVTVVGSGAPSGRGVASYRLRGPRVYAARAPAWLMAGVWGIAVTVTPPGRPPIHVVLDDRRRR